MIYAKIVKTRPVECWDCGLEKHAHLRREDAVGCYVQRTRNTCFHLGLEVTRMFFECGNYAQIADKFGITQYRTIRHIKNAMFDWSKENSPPGEDWWMFNEKFGGASPAKAFRNHRAHWRKVFSEDLNKGD